MTEVVLWDQHDLDRKDFQFQKMFAFSHEYDEEAVNGWTISDPEREFKRLGLPSSSWNYTTINSNYQLATTYPRMVGSDSCLLISQKLNNFVRFLFIHRFPSFSK